MIKEEQWPTSHFRNVSLFPSATVYGIRAPVVEPTAAKEMIVFLLALGERFQARDQACAEQFKLSARDAVRLVAEAIHAAAGLRPEDFR